MEKYLLKYLLENSENEFVRKYLDCFKIELDWFLYNYGDHISNTHLRENKRSYKVQIVELIQYFSTFLKQPKIKNSSLKNILSGVYFLRSELLHKIGYNAFSSMLQPIGYKNIIGNKSSYSVKAKIETIIQKGTFNQLFNLELFNEIDEVKEDLKNLFLDYDLRALMTYTGQYYTSKVLIDIFKDIQRPSMIFLHGLPGIYSFDVDNNADFLMVWGNKIKENYIKKGFDADKIKVTGNPKYEKIDLNKNLRNSIENILVIPYSSILWHQHGWGNPQLIDRSWMILYLYQVQNVLQRLGINHARVRPHPAINKGWLLGFVDTDFYILDYEDLDVSLAKSTLVIGAPSTTFLEAILYGVNYILFNPFFDLEKDVPPFDGSEENVFVAKTESDLENLIKDKYTIKSKIVEEYIQPLDLSILNKIIK